MELTIKQESFCQKYIECGNASDAYRFAYNCENMKPASINRKAKEQLDNGKITARVTALRAKHQETHNVTIDSLTRELEEARTQAAKEGKISAVVSAIMGKAKLHGLLIDKTVLPEGGNLVVQLVKYGSKDDNPPT